MYLPLSHALQITVLLQFLLNLIEFTSPAMVSIRIEIMVPSKILD